MKKIITLVFSIIAALAANAQVWDGTATIWTTGDGTEANPYLIESPAHLAYLSITVTTAESYEGKYFKLANDLDMGASNGLLFRPIGKYDKGFNTTTMQNEDHSAYFKGTFDGNNKALRNMNIKLEKEEESDLGGTGLFAAIDGPAHIHNLIFSNTAQIIGGQVSGSIVGFMNGGLIENIISQGKITGTMNTGGIVGVPEGGKIKNCFNSGPVSGSSEVGGICGQAAGNASIVNCVNSGPISSVSIGTGGIVSSLYESASLKGCYNTGKVTGPDSFIKPQAVGDKGTTTGEVSNNYYVKESSQATDESATAKTAEEMKTQEMVDALNNGLTPAPFVKDEKGINSGFPILAWIAEMVVANEIKQVANDATDFRLAGRTISASSLVQVYSVGGSLIGKGTNVMVPAAGLYIVKTNKTATKVIIK